MCVFRRLRNKCVIQVGQTALLYGARSQKFHFKLPRGGIHSGEIKFGVFCSRNEASLSEGSFFIVYMHPPCPFLLRPAARRASQLGECRRARLWNYMRGIIWEVPRPLVGRSPTASEMCHLAVRVVRKHFIIRSFG